jgi:hypothetical protein
MKTISFCFAGFVWRSVTSLYNSLNILPIWSTFKLSFLLSRDTLQVLGEKTEKNMEGWRWRAFQNFQTPPKQRRKEHTGNIPSNHTTK